MAQADTESNEVSAMVAIAGRETTRALQLLRHRRESAKCEELLRPSSTTGLEMAIKGKPIIVAGNPHYRDKGFSYDPSSREEYFKILDSILDNPEPAAVKKERIF